MVATFLLLCWCVGCNGAFQHPLTLTPFRGYDDKQVPAVKDWRKLARLAGVSEKDLPYVKGIAWREDRWRNRRHRNPRVGGLFGQMGCKTACPVEQLRWANRYALSRYGSWRKALREHRRKGWW